MKEPFSEKAKTGPTWEMQELLPFGVEGSLTISSMDHRKSWKLIVVRNDSDDSHCTKNSFSVFILQSGQTLPRYPSIHAGQFLGLSDT